MTTGYIISVVDQKYLPYLISLLYSLRKQSAMEKFYAVLINFQEKEKIEKKLKIIYPNIEIKHENVLLTGQKFIHYCMHRRIYYISQLMHTDLEYLIYFDADIIVRKPLSIINELNQVDLIVYKKVYKGKTYFKSGVLFINHTKVMVEFCDKWQEIYDSEKEILLGSDQSTLKTTIELFENKILIKQLPDEYFDTGREIRHKIIPFKDDSILWVGKGPSKNTPQFISSMEKEPTIL